MHASLVCQSTFSTGRLTVVDVLSDAGQVPLLHHPLQPHLHVAMQLPPPPPQLHPQVVEMEMMMDPPALPQAALPRAAADGQPASCR